jgi:hypothetical protein
VLVDLVVVVVLVLVVDIDGDGDVEVAVQSLTFRASRPEAPAICSSLASTLADQVHVAVAVNAHDQDHDQGNQDVARQI